MLKYVCEFRNRLVTFSSADGFLSSVIGQLGLFLSRYA